MSALSEKNAALKTRVLGNAVRNAKASTALYGYSLVMRDVNGDVLPLSTGRGTFDGILVGDNITTTQTDRKCVVARSGLLLATITSVAKGDIGKPVFCPTDNPADIVLTQAAGAHRVGRVFDLEYDSNGAVTNKCWVEVEGEPVADREIIHLTAARTLDRGEQGATVTNLGAAGAVLVTLPQDAQSGDKFHFCVMAAQELRITPGAAGAVYINGAKQTDNKYISADDEAEHVTLTADGNGDWVAGPYNGTWSVEA